MSPVAGSRRPTMLLFCRVTQRIPFLSKTAVCGSFAAGSGILYSVTLPVAGSTLPTVPFLLPVYQGMPLSSSHTECGNALGGNLYSFISPVMGLSRPIRLPNCPAHQIEPSAAWIGSRERWPSVGICHSVNAISAVPGMSLGARLVLGGKFVARYCVIVSRHSGLEDRSIIVPTSSFQPSLV